MRWWDGARWTAHVVWRPVVGPVRSARPHTFTIVAIVLSVLGALMMLTFLIAAMGYAGPDVNGNPPTGPEPQWPFAVVYCGIACIVAAGICFIVGRRR